MTRPGEPAAAAAGSAAPAEPATGSIDEVTDAVLTASRLLVAVSARSISAVDEDITLPQFRMLIVLAGRGPLRAGVLADLLDVHPSTATRMADRLVHARMLDREGNPDNRREVIVRLTDTGRRLVDDVTRRRRAEIATIVARMDPQPRASLVAALRAFADAGGEPSVDSSRDASALGWT
jgi:DNA-binding MarR family transcriptional regulator